jgi:heptosyltransferase-2
MALKVLIRTPNHLGDCIMAMPMINECREAYPGAHITILAPDYIGELFEGNPVIDRILRVSLKHLHGLIAVKKIRDIIADDDYDVGYVLPPSFGSASSFKLAGVKIRIGYISDGRRLLLSKPLPLPTPVNSEHRSMLYYNLLRRGANVSLDYVKPRLILSEDDDRKGARLLTEFGLETDQPYVAIACRAVAESRRWGTENYTRLAAELFSRHRLKAVLIGGREDFEAGEEIVARLGSGTIINLAGKTALRESAAVLAQAKLFAGNDSGPAHLAAAVGTPLVVLSGADDPKATSPICDRKKMLYLADLECISCVKNHCSLKDAAFMRCMRGITVEMVLSAAQELLSEQAI